MTVEVLRPSELTPDHVSAWRGFQAADPELGSAFLAPGWAQAVERAAGDRAARVVVASEGARPAAFLALRPGRYTAVAVGAPLSDRQGIVAAPGTAVDVAAMLRAAGVARFDFTHVPVEQPALAPHVQGRSSAPVVDLSGGPGAYETVLKARRSGLIKDIATRIRRLEAEFGPVRLTVDSRERPDFERMLLLKRRQYADTRQTDVIARGWSRRLLDDLFERSDEPFGGRLSTLHVGDAFAAGLFCLRSEGVLNAWFIAHDCDVARHSPGLVLLVSLIRALAAEGCWRELDFGSGDAGFKQRIATGEREIGFGYVGIPSPAAAMRGAEYRLRRWAEAAPLGRASAWPGKAMRRWDVIRSLG